MPSQASFDRGKLHFFLLIVSFCILLFFSCYKLAESPPLWFDEGFYTQVGMNVAQSGVQRIQTAPDTFISTSFITVGYPLLYPLAGAYSLFGTGVLQGRAVMVLFILGLGLVVYAFIRQLYAPRFALLSLFMLGTFPMLYGNGKTVIGEVPGLFFLASCLLALEYLEKSSYRDTRLYILVGVLAALCAATKPLYILFLAALFCTYLLRIKTIVLSIKGVLFGLIAFIAPLLLWIFLQFGPDASLSGVLATYANPSNVQNVSTLLLANIGRFLTESTPLYTALILLVWSVSLLIRRKVEKISSAEIGAFLFCLFVVISYLRIEGWYRYFFPATVVAIPFLPYAGYTVFGWLQRRLVFFSRLALLPYIAAVILGCAQLYQTAHSSFVAGYYTSTRTQDLSNVIENMDQDQSFFLYNAPALAIFMPTKNYYQYATPSNTKSIGGEYVVVLARGEADAVITMSSELSKDPALFERYTVTEQIAGYSFLKRK